MVKTNSSKTQKKKKKFDRWKNSTESFQLKDIEYLENKNVLLKDDLITTGATLEACPKELQRTKNISLYIATMAYTTNF